MDLESGFMGFSSLSFIYDSSEANIYSKSVCMMNLPLLGNEIISKLFYFHKRNGRVLLGKRILKEKGVQQKDSSMKELQAWISHDSF